jgi:hypothetical protein
VQNRAAQRNFRERQKEYVLGLERQVETLKMEIAKLHENYQGLLKAVAAPRLSQQWPREQLSPASLDGGPDYSVEDVPIVEQSQFGPSTGSTGYVISPVGQANGVNCQFNRVKTRLPFIVSS